VSLFRVFGRVEQGLCTYQKEISCSKGLPMREGSPFSLIMMSFRVPAGMMPILWRFSRCFRFLASSSEFQSFWWASAMMTFLSEGEFFKFILNSERSVAGESSSVRSS